MVARVNIVPAKWQDVTIPRSFLAVGCVKRTFTLRMHGAGRSSVSRTLSKVEELGFNQTIRTWDDGLQKLSAIKAHFRRSNRLTYTTL